MPREIRREEVRRLIDQGVQLVEVLPAKEYREDHLPGAINLPLRQLETEARSALDVSRPVDDRVAKGESREATPV